MRFPPLLLLLLGIPLAQTPYATGIKMTVRNTLGPTLTTERTTYFEADRKREEWRSSEGGKDFWGSPTITYGPHAAMITRCDLGKEFMLNLDAHEYSAIPYPPKFFAEALAKAKAQPRPATSPQPPKPTVRIETTTVDTGEREQIFGRTARHMMITQKYIPLAGSAEIAQESVTDAWYIDLDTQLSCDFKFPPGTRAHSFGATSKSEVPEFVDSGESPKGFSVAQTTRITSSLKSPDGSTQQHTSQSEMSVVDFVNGPLDPALFEIPAGFKLVDNVELNPPQQVPSAWERLKARWSNLFRD